MANSAANAAPTVNTLAKASAEAAAANTSAAASNNGAPKNLNNANRNNNSVANNNATQNNAAASAVNNNTPGVGMTIAEPANLAKKMSVAVPPPPEMSEIQRNPAPQQPAIMHMSQKPERYDPRVSDPELVAYEEQVSGSVRQLLKTDLERYCLDYCSILSIDAEAKEVFETGNTDLGFESIANPGGIARKFRVKRVLVEVLVDSRYGSENIEKLQRVFDRVSPRYGRPMFFTWSRVSFPENASTQKSEAEVRSEFATQVKHQVERIIGEFCPTECKLSSIDVEVARATMDEAERGSVQRFLFARDGRGALFVRGVQARVTMNSTMDSVRKAQITELLREALLPFGSVSLEVNTVAFPRPASEIQKDLDDQRRDPYGIEKFGALMKLFKENMVGKEVYKETTKESSNAQERMESSQRESRNSQNTLESKESSERSATNTQRDKELSNVEKSTLSSSEKSLEDGTLKWILAGTAVILTLLAVGAFLYIRHILKSQRMKEIVAEGTGAKDKKNEHEAATETKDDKISEEGSLIREKLEFERLKDECLKLFVAEPKLAREAFTRILKEDGAEATSKYIVIFGEIVVYELLKDLDLKESLNELAEYVHLNAPRVENSEKVELLRQLRLKLTAAKVKLLTNRTLDVFDFMKGWSPRQVFELAREEIPQMQGIILTQLNVEKRKAVFEMFREKDRTPVLEALSQIDIMPREVLIGAAETIKEKATKNPRFDAENVRGTDVLIDLLTSAPLEQQVALMLQLDESNPPAAWRIRSSLISSETLLHIPDHLLVDSMFDLELREVASFLSAAQPSYRSALFAKIPVEIRANWAEAMAGEQADAELAKVIETKLLQKVRQLSTKGTINLAEINDRIYPRGGGKVPAKSAPASPPKVHPAA
jgi:flagellar motor switch protein FliG